MKNYKVEIEETLTRVIEVQATNEEEAFETIYEQYHEGEIVLSGDDWEETKFYILDDSLNRIRRY